MSRADRVAAIGRRVFRAEDWPWLAAASLSLVALLEVFLFSTDRGGDLSTTLVLALGATMPLALGRTHVVAAATIATTSIVLTLAADYRLTAAGLVALMVLLYLLGWRRVRRWYLLLLAPFVVYALAPWNGAGEFLAILLLLSVTAAFALGNARWVRAEEARRNASDRVLADTMLEHAARGERARIARELHDVVAHHISMISVQAETARLATAGMPAEGAKRLSAIGDTAREALTEMRRLLGVLREDADTEPTRAPQPGLRQLTELIDEARAASSASTRLIVRGNVTALDPGVELTAYRIVQEALTNARRHAAGTAVDVEFEYGTDELRISVRDNGPGPSAAEPEGHGLLGMRERAAMVGGKIAIGRAPGSGFLVEAVLPLPGSMR